MLIYYAQKPSGDRLEFRHIYPCRQRVRMCGAPEEEIVTVAISISPCQEVPLHPHGIDYWGWKEKGKEGIDFIYPSYTQFSMCFPYGWQRLAEAGEGMVYRLEVDEVTLEEAEEVLAIHSALSSPVSFRQ